MSSRHGRGRKGWLFLLLFFVVIIIIIIFI